MADAYRATLCGGHLSRRGLLTGLFIASGYWMLETFFHCFLIGHESLAQAFMSADANEIWMRSSVFAILLFGTSYVTALRSRNRRAIAAIFKVKSKVIKGLIPICAYCKKVRYPDGSWHGIERFVASNSTAQFTHGICPECTGRPM